MNFFQLFKILQAGMKSNVKYYIISVLTFLFYLGNYKEMKNKIQDKDMWKIIFLNLKYGKFKTNLLKKYIKSF